MFYEYDARTESCPLPLVKLRVILKKMSNVKNLKHKTHKPFVRPTNVPFLITKKTDFEKETNWKPKLNFDKILLDTLNYWRNRLDTSKF